jgi:hypothetical protein
LPLPRVVTVPPFDHPAHPHFSIMPLSSENDPRAEQCYERCRSPPVQIAFMLVSDVEVSLPNRWRPGM